MSTNDQAVPLAPVPPSPVVRVAMRPLTRMLNPLMRKLAGRRHRNTFCVSVRDVGTSP
jgi:hypothetical protein